VVLADHSDRSGSATWILQQVIAQDLSDVLLASNADRTAVEAVRAKGLKGGDPFDMDMGGLADESAGQPVRIRGTIAGVAQIAGRLWVNVAFGRDNVVLISEYLTQVMDPLDLKGAGLHDRPVQGVRHQVARPLPPRLRRFGLREDDPVGRAGAAVPRHGTTRGAALHERRHLEILSVRRRQLSLSERSRAFQQRSRPC